jgi:transglutaminase-like putative cysteine protease
MKKMANNQQLATSNCPTPNIQHPTSAINHCLLYLLLTISCSLAQAQTKFNLAQLKTRYPDDEMAYLNRTERVMIDLKEGKPAIDVFHTEERVFLSERASVFADDRVTYSETFQQISDLQAFIFVPDKTSFKKIAVTDIKTERPSPGGGIFYDDALVKKFTYPSAQKGGVGLLTYRETIKDPHFLSGFLFGNYMPTIYTEFSVTFPASVKVSYKTYGDAKLLQFSKTIVKDKTTYTWKAQNLKPYAFEPDSPPIRAIAPQVQLFIESYTANNQTTAVLGDVDKLFGFYKNLIKNLNQQPDQQLKAIADSLTRGKSETDKIKSVYYWVQDHIKYIAFEEGLGGFVPRQAADVCRKRYGDCKDMASLITAMLNIANVPAKMVWIGTRDIPYRYIENPSLAVDNHAIAAVKQNGKWVFLDATDDRIDYGPPTTHIQGKEAMIMTSADGYEIAEVPVVPAHQNYKRDSMVVSWQGRTLIGKGSYQLDGYTKGYTKAALQARSEPQRQEYYKDVFSRGSNKSMLEKIAVTKLNEREKPLRFDYDFKVPDYVQQAGNEIFINPHLKKTWSDQRKEKNRQSDWRHEYQSVEDNTVVLPIPAGYEVSYLPKNASFRSDAFGGFELTYELLPNKVIVRNKLTLNTLLIKKTSFVEWNLMVSALNEAYSEVISLKKK